jgi:type I restriction enzyme, S subunit
VTKKHQIQQGTMQELIRGKSRLPGFNQAWKQTSLDAVSTRAAGFWGKSSPDTQHCVAANVIRAGDISPTGDLLATASRYLTLAEFGKAQCERDDVVITGSGSVGKVWWCDGRPLTTASNFVRIVRPLSSRLSGAFLFHLLRSDATQALMTKHISVGVLANLSNSFFYEPWLALPPRAEQEAIATILNDMSEEIFNIETSLAKARQIKQGMIQNLLTGRIRLL